MENEENILTEENKNTAPFPINQKKNLLVPTVALVIIIAGLLLTAAMILIPYLTRGTLPVSNSHGEKYVLMGNVRTDGTCVFVLENGETVTLGDNAVTGYISPDRRHIYYYCTDGSLCVTDRKQSYQKIIDTAFVHMEAVTDNGILYRAHEGGELKRYLWEDESTVTCHADVLSTVYAKNSLTFMTLDEKGCAQIYREDSHVTAMPDSAHMKEVKLRFVSRDGNVAAFEGVKDGKHVLAVDSDSYLEFVELAAPIADCYPSMDENLVIFQDTFRREAVVVRRGCSPVLLQYDSQISDFYTDDGVLKHAAVSPDTPLYFRTEFIDGSRRMHLLHPDGTVEDLYHGIKNYHIRGGKILVLDDDHTLYIGDIHHGKVQNSEELVGDVKTYYLSDFSRYLYYIGTDNAVKCYDRKENKTHFVTEQKIRGIRFSPDGRAVLYTVTDTASYTTALYYKELGEKAVLLTDDVKDGSLYWGSMTDDLYFNPEQYIFYCKTDVGHSSRYDVYRCNRGHAEKIEENINVW